jgi:hypothetical protein
VLLLLIPVASALGGLAAPNPRNPLNLPPRTVRDPQLRDILRTMSRAARGGASNPQFPYLTLWVGQHLYTYTSADGVLRGVRRIPPRTDRHRGTGIARGWAYGVWTVEDARMRRASNGLGQVILRHGPTGRTTFAVFQGSEFSSERALLIRQGLPESIIRDLDIDVH